MDTNRDWTRIDANRGKNQDEPQMDADEMRLLRSSQENLAKVGRRIALLNELNRSQHYLRLSAVGLGFLFVSIRIHSRLNCCLCLC
jgi:hypothetical protein